MAGSATPATVALEHAGLAHVLHEFAHVSRTRAFGDEAVAALGVAPDRVLKTLVARADDDRLLIGIVAVDAQLDLKALAKAVGVKKTVLADVADAERATGYVHGGISPFAQRRSLPTVLDSAAAQHDRVFVSGGRRGLQIELAPADLVVLANAVLAPIAR